MLVPAGIQPSDVLHIAESIPVSRRNSVPRLIKMENSKENSRQAPPGYGIPIPLFTRMAEVSFDPDFRVNKEKTMRLLK